MPTPSDTGATGAAATAALLREAWSALGGDADHTGLLRLSPWRPGLLPSALPALPAMVAAVGSSALAVSVLDAARRRHAPSPVDLDVEHVAVAARSERFAHERGAPAPALFAPLSRFWRTADGWVRTHANYAWHRQRLLRVLDCGDGPEEVAEAVRAWRGRDLEDACAAAGALAYAVLGREEWRAHPQGRAVAGLPLVETSAAGAPGALPRGAALEGVRVLDLTRVIAGPVATRTLAAWGADVLRLDSPRLPEIEAQTLDTLPGKRSAELDAADPPDRERLEALLADADVVVQGYRPGALARHGLDAAALAERHPHLTVVTLSAWGRLGPWSGRRGFDSLVQAPTGIAATEGPGDRPGALPAQVLDHATGYLAAAAAVLSLSAVARGEPARHAELSLARTAEWLQSLGTADPEEARDPDASPYVVEVPGPDRTVGVVRPPGRVGPLRPGWRTTTRLGADEPEFRPRPVRSPSP